MTKLQEPSTVKRAHINFGGVVALIFGLAGVVTALAVVTGPSEAHKETAPSSQLSSAVSADEQSPRPRSSALYVPDKKVATDDLPSAEVLSRAFTAVAKLLEPAVVNIFTEGAEASPHERPSETPFDEFFERFFRDRQQRPRRSLGSGVIVDPRGYIVTNNHVVANAKTIEVQFANERRFFAEVVGTDAPTDLAVLRIKSDEQFEYVNFGESKNLVVGEWVLAMGNPFGFGHTVTAGIISAKGRLIGQGTYDDFIQTDAAINPGNSGGPLVNMSGEIVGINSNIISNSGGNMGIGFAIPADMARKVYVQLIADGKVTRGWLGVGIQNLTPELAEQFGIGDIKGALISDILGDDSPAAKAGLRAGDVIVEINGVPVDSNNHLVHLVADLRPGESVLMKYIRDGEARETEVTLSRRTIDDEPNSSEAGAPEDRGRLGIVGRNLTEELMNEIGATSSTGVVLMDVDPDGPAVEAGLRRGDIIVEANRQPIRGTDDLSRVLSSIEESGDLLLRIERVVRGQQSSFLYVPVRLR